MRAAARHRSSSPWTTGALVLCAVFLLASSSNINWGGDHWRNVLQADARGYHSYLPAYLIHHDPNLGFFDTLDAGRYYDPDRFYDHRIAIKGNVITRYFAGTALAASPFFLAAHAYARFSGDVADGYTKPYVVSINLAAIAWVMLGLFGLATLLHGYAVPDRLVAFTLVVFAFGTNLFYYTVVAPGMSHAFSFGACTALLAVCARWEREGGDRWIVMAGALLGLIVLIRPVNGLILLAIPVVLNEPLAALRRLVTGQRAIALAGALAISIAGLQAVHYRIATGHWWVYSYGEEGFHWTEPHLLDILWSYKKGLFVYTPLLLLAFAGLPAWWGRSRMAPVRWAVFLFVLSYVLSSWWNWWYGGSFGSRVYVEYLGLFAIPFALGLSNARPIQRRAWVATSVVLVVVCLIQTYQARYYQIHWEDMDRERYWKEFLRIDRLL